MFRKRKNPTPNFRMPPPFSPMTGENATLQVPGVFPYSALVQVAAEDIYDNYVLCRGFDVRIAKFIDYEEGNADKPGLPVGKPYGRRRPGAYKVAQVFQALLPLQTTNPSPADVDWRIRQNPGFAVGGKGHPEDLAEKIDELYTFEGKLINYMLIDEGGNAGQMVLFSIAIVEVPFCRVIGTVLGRPCGVAEVDDEEDGEITIYDNMCCMFNERDEDLIGRMGWATRIELDAEYAECCSPPLETCIWSVVSLCCPDCTAVSQSQSAPSSGGTPAAMITGSGPGPIPGQFLP